MQFAEQLHHRFTALRIEIAGRFVGEQDRRLASHRARHCHPLLLPAGQLARQVAGAMGDADPFERFLRALPPVGRPETAVGERQLDVLADGEIGMC